MGLAIFLVYVPTFAITVVISLLIGIYIPRKIRRTETEEALKALAKTRKKAYIIGAITSILITIIGAWWCSKTMPGLGSVTIPIIISLFVPSIIGLTILPAAFILKKSGLKEKSYALFYTAASAFQTTFSIPIIFFFFYSLLDALHDFMFPMLFKTLCKNTGVEIIEPVRPPKGFALIPEWRKPKRHQETDPEQLLLSANTPLQFVETVHNPSTLNEELTRLTKKASGEPNNNGNDKNNMKYKGPFDQEKVKSLDAEYYVRFTKTKIPQAFNLENDTEGQILQIERASDNKIIASAKGYWNSKNNMECPEGFGDKDFVIKFIAETLRLPRP